jgi:TonB family protein
MRRTIFLFLFTVFSVAMISAQQQDAVLKHAAKLQVPKEARESGYGGRVVVRVAIDEAGKVTSAEITSGPGPVCPAATRPDVDAMRSAAKASALKTIFSPATKDGKPVRSAVLLNYDFPAVNAWDDRPKIEGGAYMVRETTASGGRIVQDENNPRILTDDKLPNPIGGGVLNGKATSLPKPAYPAAARAVRAGGAVNIQVLIDTDGTVFSAEPVAGHPLLRSAAKAAACGSRFTPILLSGQPVRVAGIITYNFVP